MWRLVTIEWTAISLALPATSGAATPAPYLEVGRPGPGGAIAIPPPGHLAGAGTHIYAVTGLLVTGESLWSSADRGASWKETPRPLGDDVQALFVSRDDPLTAYAPIWSSRDGYPCWVPATAARPGRLLVTEHAASVSSVAPGDPLHVIASHDHAESRGGGATFTALPVGQPCAGLDERDDPTGATGKRLYRFGNQHDGPVTLMGPDPAPVAYGVVDSRFARRARR